ncbi:MAG: hypothetical protein IKA61_04140 [Clostridia bacterium]|nr:hypothetical protein [Clostridia bacterium]
MFDTKCIYCKHFNKDDGCAKNLDEDFCKAFEELENQSLAEDKPSCESCAFNSNGFCDYDLESPLTCRRYKSLKEDL